MILQTAVLSILLCSVQSFTLQDRHQASVEKSDESSGNMIEEDDASVSSLLEKANANLGKNPGDPLVMFGDIAMPTGLGNADPCTARGCLWPKASNGNVNVPYRISKQYSSKRRSTIIQAMKSFAESTCIRFIPRKKHKDFLDIWSDNGCYSYVGRRGGNQTVSLQIKGCVYHETIQHELLHALGFEHEQNRSDRDQYIKILWKNIKDGLEDNFEWVETRNLGTPYDYNSIMQYEKDAFSKNGKPTMVPIPDKNVPIGLAKEMSPTDILRVNRLYRCNPKASQSDVKAAQRNQFL